MKNLNFLSIALASVLLLMCGGFVSLDAASGHPKTSGSKHELNSATVLAFGPDNVLFIGDSKAGMIHAVPTSGDAVKQPIPFNLLDLDLKLAAYLEMKPRDLIIHDMKIHPVSQEAYIAVRKGHQPDAKSVIAVVNAMGGKIRLLDVSKGNRKSVAISNPPSEDLKFWRDIPASVLTITDLDFFEGNLYVAGLSNGEFASTLRKIAYPFNGKSAVVGGIEIYHAIHTQYETRAPIRTMMIEELNGVPTLLASYTCTPLVTIPLSEIKAGNKIKGKTIAELGYGNTPVDMLSMMIQGQDGSVNKMLMVTHKHRSASLIPMVAVEKAATEKGMADVTGLSGEPTGLPITPSPTNFVMHIDNQNQMMVTVLKRNLDSGALELVSEIKGVFLRLSEFISEYDFPDYRYPTEQGMTKKFHDQIKPMEGYPDLTSDKTGK